MQPYTRHAILWVAIALTAASTGCGNDKGRAVPAVIDDQPKTANRLAAPSDPNQIVVGQELMPIKGDAAMRAAASRDAELVAWRPGTCFVTVEEVNGDWLRTRQGWIMKSDVVPCDRGIAFFSRQISQSPSVFALCSRSLARLDAKEYQAARDDADEAVALDPADARGFFCRGSAAAYLGDIDAAFADFGRAIARDGGFATAHLNRGHTRFEKGDLRGAVADYDNAILHDPSVPHAYRMRGHAHRAMKAYTQAIADFTECIRRNDSDARAYMGRAMAYRDLSRGAFAMRDINACIKRSPGLSSAYFIRALLWRVYGENKRSVADAETAVKLAPNDEDGYALLGALAYDGGDYRRAMREFNNVIRVNPQCATAYALRALIWATCPDESLRDGIKAIESASAACKLSNFREPLPISSRAAAYAEVSDFRSAIEWQMRVVEMLRRDGTPRADEQALLRLYRDGRPCRLTTLRIHFSPEIAR